MAQNASKNKFQLDLLDEKRAFVVIALTDKLKQPGKLVAMNALAHYNSQEGHSWASVPAMAVESGYSATSTKTINSGLEEIEKVGAFKIVRTKGGAKNTHRICPVMSWFKAEYDLIRASGKVANDNDEFADIRTVDDNPGPQPELDDHENETKVQDHGNPGPQPGQPGFTTRLTRVQNPTKRTKEANRQKRTNPNDVPASGERGPAGGLISGDDDQRQKGVHDHVQQDGSDQSAKVAPFPVDMFQQFMGIYTLKGGNPNSIKKELAKIEREGRTDHQKILKGALNYMRQKKGTNQSDHISDPANFLRNRDYEGYYQTEPPPIYRRNVAI